MTYSIVARDARSGELGVAVATGWPAVGSVVPWAEPGVGAVATQSFTNVDLGPLGLDLLRAGRSAPEAVESLVDADAGRDVRQLGIVDARGRSAAFTGDACVAEAGHACAAGVSTQGNMLERPGLWSRMLSAFEAAAGDLAERLLAALAAAEAQGGDVRGIRSAALLVVPGLAARPWSRRFDLRVEEASAPIVQLGRLLRNARAYEALGAALETARAGDTVAALVGTSSAVELEPDDPHLLFWHAVLLTANGRPTEGRPLLERALRAEPRLALFARRYADAGHGGGLAATIRELGRPTH